MSKIKVLYLLLVLNIVALTSSLAETISGNVSYLGMTSTGKFWVWASTVPVKSEGHNPIAISSYTVDNNNVNFNYVLVIPTQFLPNRLYIYAMRDWHPPFVEEFLQGQKQINPLYGDPFGEVPGGIFVNVGENPTNISIIVKDPPQGRITGRIDYSGVVPANSVLKIAVGRGEGDWIDGPADYKEISQPSFPYLYELNFLADATDYYIVAILDDFNPATIDPFVKYGPVVISSATGSIATVNLTLPLPPGKISGTIYYEQTVLPFVGILRIVAGDGPPREGWNVVSFQEVSISSFPYNYTLSGIPDGNNFYVSVSLLQIVNNEPILIASGLRGPVEVSPNNNRHAAGIRVDLRLPGGGSGISSNAISGNINYSGVAVGYVYVKVGLGTPSGIYDVKGTFSRYGLGPYQIYNLPNGENYYIEAFLDINNNGLWDAGMM
ncbi:MAG: hypothetical protein N2643_05430 [Endomicrobia bacterium]|nr:hypothetical protein [Endomicrobiia bacterium]